MPSEFGSTGEQQTADVPHRHVDGEAHRTNGPPSTLDLLCCPPAPLPQGGFTTYYGNGMPALQAPQQISQLVVHK
jgi:hypothetical protein